jgi:hypothetical protein
VNSLSASKCLRRIKTSYFRTTTNRRAPYIIYADFEALNLWLAQRCRDLAARKHPITPERAIADCFAQEQGRLGRITATFDGYV